LICCAIKWNKAYFYSWLIAYASFIVLFEFIVIKLVGDFSVLKMSFKHLLIIRIKFF
jgi:hypothetical protein